MGDVLAQAKADARAGTRLDEAVHGPGVEGVLSVDELRMQDHVALLGRAQGLEVGQALPVLEVLGAHDARRRDRGREIRIARILALGAEHAVDPAVLVLGQAHVVDVGLLRAGVGQRNGIVPEVEAVDAGVGLGHREEGLAVRALHAHDEVELAVEVDRAAVEHGVDAQALHEVGIRLGVEVVSPVHGREFAREHGILVAVIDTVVDVGYDVLAGDQLVHLRLFHVIIGMQHVSFSSEIFGSNLSGCRFPCRYP